MDFVYKNYEAFYNMVLSTTIMSNSMTSALKADAKEIISYIGKAYRLDDERIANCVGIITEKLSRLGLTTEQQATYNGREYGKDYSDDDILFDVKGDVLTRLSQLGNSRNSEINPEWFNYTYYMTYQPDIRYAEINAAGECGNLIATRQAGILKILGIGCEADPTEGASRLIQCMFWGDIPSIYYLRRCYELQGNESLAKLFSELAELASKYLRRGLTVIPSSDKSNYSDRALKLYNLISSIKQDVVHAYERYSIDFSFVEAIQDESLDYFAKMGYINNYDKKQWKNITNSADRPARKLGFN